jgi:hypothetical protein
LRPQRRTGMGELPSVRNEVAVANPPRSVVTVFAFVAAHFSAPSVLRPYRWRCEDRRHKPPQFFLPAISR